MSEIEELKNRIELLELQVSRLMMLEVEAVKKRDLSFIRCTRAALHARLSSIQEHQAISFIASLHQLEKGKWSDPRGLAPANPEAVEKILHIKDSGKIPTLEDKIDVVAPIVKNSRDIARSMIQAWEGGNRPSDDT